MDGHRDPVRRISKRRGSKGTKQPRAAVRTQAPVTPPWNPPRAVGYVVVGLILLFSIEAAMAGTALITPISPLFLKDRKSVVSGKWVAVRVALGGGRIMKQKKLKKI